MGVTHLYKICFYTENATGSINLQGTVNGKDYTVKFSKAVQSDDVLEPHFGHFKNSFLPF